MEKSFFYELINKQILPLFTGSFLVGEMESSARDLEVALGMNNKTILLKPTKTDLYRIILKRGRAFKTFEVEIIRNIIQEFNSIYEMSVEDQLYSNQLYDLAIEKSLIQSITESGSETVLNIIKGLEDWSARTYEGKPVQLGILVNLHTLSDGTKLNFNDIIQEDFFALFTDGQSSFMEFDRNGNVLGYVNLKKTKTVPTVSPYVYDRLARICNDKRIGIVLTGISDILVFYGAQLLFAKRNGRWGVYSHEEIIRLLLSNVSYAAKEIRRAVYNTALDCSFAYKGACIAYLNKDMCASALTHIDAADIISEEHFNIKKKQELEESEKLYNLDRAKEIIEEFSLPYEDFLNKNKYSKTIAIRKIVAGKKLFELDRKLIEEMMSVDGATVIDFDGTIIAVGAIIKIEAGSLNGGGRLAATKTMAKYGVAIKVSQDGIMQGYAGDKQGKIKQLFKI